MNRFCYVNFELGTLHIPEDRQTQNCVEQIIQKPPYRTASRLATFFVVRLFNKTGHRKFS